jgi:hemerythrin
VLRQLANTLRDGVRTDDVVGRLGGDGFFIICPNTSLEGAMKVADAVVSAVAAMRVPTGEGCWEGSVSVGVAVRTPDMEGITDLVKLADEGVYLAKRDGKGCARTLSSPAQPHPRRVGAGIQADFKISARH